MQHRKDPRLHQEHRRAGHQPQPDRPQPRGEVGGSPAPLTRLEWLLAAQERAASKVVLEDRLSPDLIAGVDQAFISEEGERGLAVSGTVVLDPSFRIRSRSSAGQESTVPYVPSLLSFREDPAALEAARRLDPTPAHLFVDGCGIKTGRGWQAAWASP
ncbi:MAG: endonuclease V [Methanothrix sp.]|nr:endonuclease V [Methanothrix sp.]